MRVRQRESVRGCSMAYDNGSSGEVKDPALTRFTEMN